MRTEHYAGIDLHSDNHYLGIMDQDGRRIYQRRLKNQLPEVLAKLEPIARLWSAFPSSRLTTGIGSSTD